MTSPPRRKRRITSSWFLSGIRVNSLPPVIKGSWGSFVCKCGLAGTQESLPAARDVPHIDLASICANLRLRFEKMFAPASLLILVQALARGQEVTSPAMNHAEIDLISWTSGRRMTKRVFVLCCEFQARLLSSLAKSRLRVAPNYAAASEKTALEQFRGSLGVRAEKHCTVLKRFLTAAAPMSNVFVTFIGFIGLR